MKNHFDFIIDESELFDGEKIVLRMYPRKSSLHVFDVNKPNKTTDDIYKTYLSFAIFENQYDKDGACIHHEVLYDCPFDECSAMAEGRLPEYLRAIVKNDNGEDRSCYDVMSLGYGTIWEIETFRSRDEYKNERFFVFTLVSNANWKAYRFVLDEHQTLELADTIEQFVQYMLEHAVEI